MFNFAQYRWPEWCLFTLFVVTLPWLWSLWVIGAVVTGAMWLNQYLPASTYNAPRGRPRSSANRPTRWRPRPIRSRAIKPYRAPRVKREKVYKGRWLKNGMYSTYDPVFKRWRNRAKDSTWTPPPD